jgi:REP element-mobilizing transposase RayT
VLRLSQHSTRLASVGPRFIGHASSPSGLCFLVSTRSLRPARCFVGWVVGIGHGRVHAQQLGFEKVNWQHRFSHGGTLRRRRAGRGSRPLSTKESLHLVFKVNRERLKYGGLRHGVTYTLVQQIVRRWAKYFFVKVEQVSVQGDHIHLLIRAPGRAKYLNFFRVVSGQIAQRLEQEGLLAVPPTGSKERDSDGSKVEDSLPAGSKTKASSRTIASSSRKAAGTIEAAKSTKSRSPETRGASVTDTPTAPRAGDKLGKLTGTGLWKHRPFSRVVRGYKAYTIIRDYIQLNEQEALDNIPYRKSRLRGLSAGEWELLWA